MVKVFLNAKITDPKYLWAYPVGLPLQRRGVLNTNNIFFKIYTASFTELGHPIGTRIML